MINATNNNYNSKLIRCIILMFRGKWGLWLQVRYLVREEEEKKALLTTEAANPSFKVSIREFVM